MLETRLIFPLLYKSFTTLKGPAWYFEDGVFLTQLYDEDYGAIYSAGTPEHKANVLSGTKCIYLKNPIIPEFHIFAKQVATKLRFVLNRFSTGTTVVLPYAFLTNTDRKTRLINQSELEINSSLQVQKSENFKLRTSASRDTISDYYKVVKKVCSDNKGLFFTLERYNSALTQYKGFDRIVNLTIALESLIDGTNELKYRFSLFNAFIAEDSPDKRLEAFVLFQKLYDARSSIVHGDISTDKKVKQIDFIHDKWDDILRLSSLSLNYYLFFLFENSRSDWDDHLKKLVFGKDPRIL